MFTLCSGCISPGTVRVWQLTVSLVNLALRPDDPGVYVFAVQHWQKQHWQKLVKPQCCCSTIEIDTTVSKKGLWQCDWHSARSLNTPTPRSGRSRHLPTEAGAIPEICCAAAAAVGIQTCSLLRGLWRRSNPTLHFNNSRGSRQQPHTNTGVGICS